MRTTLLIALASTSLGAAIALAPVHAAPVQEAGKPYVQDTQRGMTRVVYFGNDGVSGEYAIEFGKPQWKAEFEQQIEKSKGKRLRLGNDYWTTLDTFCPLSIGGKDLKPGLYFLALDLSAKGEWSLVTLDPEPLRKVRFDAFGSAQTKGGTDCPMAHEATKDPADSLSIRFIADEKDSRQQTLEIRFGKHRLTAPVKPKA